jgi:hypothetical protein
MNKFKRGIASALVGLYPVRWRHEYGTELADLLLRRRLVPTAVLNVVCSALRQQLRIGEPWLILGVPFLAFNLAMLVWGIHYPWVSVNDSFPLIWHLASWLLTASVGFWTVLRNPECGRGGGAAVKFTLLATAPLVAVVIAVVMYDHRSLDLFILPKFNVVSAALSGWIGGRMALAYLQRRSANCDRADSDGIARKQ